MGGGIGRSRSQKKINWRTLNKMVGDWPGQLSQQGNNFSFLSTTVVLNLFELAAH